MSDKIRDARGHGFEARDYRRIVSLVPSWTESLFAVGAGARVVAITDYCCEPREAVAGVRKIGGTKNPRLQEILALRPDLLIANVEENRRADVARLEAGGVPVFVTDARTVRGALDELTALGALVGVADIQSKVEPIERAYAEALALQGSLPRLRVFVAVWRDPWMTVNGETFVNDMVELSGGENVFHERARRFPLSADLREGPPRQPQVARDTRYPRVSVEEIVERAPEVILLPDEPYPFSEQDAAEWRARREIPAAQHERVWVVDGKVLSWYGVRMGESLRTLRVLLHGAA